MDKPRYYASREFPIQNFHGRTTDNHIPRDDISTITLSGNVIIIYYHVLFIMLINVDMPTIVVIYGHDKLLAKLSFYNLRV